MIKKLFLAFTYLVLFSPDFCINAFAEEIENKKFDITLQNSSPYIEIKFSPEDSFRENIDKYNVQIDRDKKDFISYYSRGKIYYDYAEYLFNIYEISKTDKEIKINQDKYFKYFNLSVEDFENSIKINPDYIDSYVSLSRSLMRIDKVLDKIFLNIDKNFKSLGYVESLSNKRSLYTLGRSKLEKMGKIYNAHLKTLKDLEKSKDNANKYALENIKKAQTLSLSNPDIFQIYSEYYFNIGNYQVKVSETFPLEKVGDAHQYIQERKNIGKVILTI